MLKTDSIKTFLEKCTLPDLAELYDAEMEVQVNVAKDDGEIIKSKGGKRSYMDAETGEEWQAFRIPYKANTEPEYTDADLKFDLGKHVDGVGLSGWNWKRQVSMWVGYDFDAIVGHDPKHGNKLSAEELDRIKNSLENVPYVTVRVSTGGLGLHVYVFLENVPTKNHTEHAALARAILDKLSIDSGCDLKTSVDVCGAILWIWHRKLLKAQGGLKLLKQGEKLRNIPANWRDHIGVVSGKRNKSKPDFVTKDTEELFNTLSSHRHKVQLDSEHRALIEFINSGEYFFEYKADHNMMTTHTHALAMAHEALGLKGIFKTESKGSEPGDKNCFCFPMRDGAWVIRRFTPKTQEADTWDRDDRGYTRCFFNKPPDFRLACIANGGLEQKGGDYLFGHASEAETALMTLGVTVPIPLKYQARPMCMLEKKDGKIYCTMTELPGDQTNDLHAEGWNLEKGTWKKVLGKPFSTYEEAESINYDMIVRSLVVDQGNVGWSMNTNGNWIAQPIAHVSMYLKSLGMDGATTTQVMGNSISKYWTLVNRPFQPEYPGEREWNRDAAQLKVTPTENGDNLHYPHWSKILRHLGESLNGPLKQEPWAQLNGVETGEDYLRLWIASMIKHPEKKLPYLFFVGHEDCGKTVFVEAIGLLLSKGIVKADNALMNQSNFNGELENAILCYIEETDLSKNKTVMNRLKDYITALQIYVRPLYMTGHMVPNYTHWVQTANRLEFGPTVSGDTRQIVLRVQNLDPMEMIPKEELLDRLKDEAADFLKSILDLEIPDTPSRLNLPVIKTEEKAILQDISSTPVEEFIRNYCYSIPGAMICGKDLLEKFLQTVDDREKGKWSAIAFNRQLPLDNPIGKNTKRGGDRYVINLSFDPHEKPKESLKIVDGWIRPASYIRTKGEGEDDE